MIDEAQRYMIHMAAPILWPACVPRLIAVILHAIRNLDEQSRLRHATAGVAMEEAAV